MHAGIDSIFDLTAGRGFSNLERRGLTRLEGFHDGFTAAQANKFDLVIAQARHRKIKVKGQFAGIDRIDFGDARAASRVLKGCR